MTGHNRTVSRITAVINRDFQGTTGTMREMREYGLSNINFATGRTVMLREHSAVVNGLFKRPSPLVSSPVDIVTFSVDSAGETEVLSAIADRFSLAIPGSGSVYSETVTHVRGEGHGETPIQGGCAPVHFQNQLTGICCIIFRGLGDHVARVALETGSCVPTITFGEGAGLRDRLGLWRILIPADKEIVTMVVNSFEAEEIMDMIIDVVKMDQPGRGFIYTYPERQGLINLKVSQTSQSQAASIEQVVLAIDELKGSTEWRRRRLSPAMPVVDIRKKHRLDLTELMLHCDEGSGAGFVRLAMESGGAPGGTQTPYSCFISSGNGPKKQYKVRACEACSMVVDASQMDTIQKAFVEAKVFENRSIIGLETKSVYRAFSYGAA